MAPTGMQIEIEAPAILTPENLASPNEASAPAIAAAPARSTSSGSSPPTRQNSSVSPPALVVPGNAQTSRSSRGDTSTTGKAKEGKEGRMSKDPRQLMASAAASVLHKEPEQVEENNIFAQNIIDDEAQDGPQSADFNLIPPFKKWVKRTGATLRGVSLFVYAFFMIGANLAAFSSTDAPVAEALAIASSCWVVFLLFPLLLDPDIRSRWRLYNRLTSTADANTLSDEKKPGPGGDGSRKGRKSHREEERTWAACYKRGTDEEIDAGIGYNRRRNNSISAMSLASDAADVDGSGIKRSRHASDAMFSSGAAARAATAANAQKRGSIMRRTCSNDDTADKAILEAHGSCDAPRESGGSGGPFPRAASLGVREWATRATGRARSPGQILRSPPKRRKAAARGDGGDPGTTVQSRTAVDLSELLLDQLTEAKQYLHLVHDSPIYWTERTIRSIGFSLAYIWGTYFLTERLPESGFWDFSAMPQPFILVMHISIWMTTFDYLFEMHTTGWPFVLSFGSLALFVTLPVFFLLLGLGEKVAFFEDPAGTLLRYNLDTATQPFVDDEVKGVGDVRPQYFLLQYGWLRFLELYRVNTLTLAKARVASVGIQTASLVIGILCILLTMAGSIHSFEAPSDLNPSFTSFEHFFYFSLVTVTTVGYGDFFPSTGLSRVACMAGIIIAVTWVPVQLSRLQAALAHEGTQLGKPPDRSEPYCLLLGNISKLQLQVFFRQVSSHKISTPARFVVLSTAPLKELEVHRLSRDEQRRIYFEQVDILKSLSLGTASHKLLLRKATAVYVFNRDKAVGVADRDADQETTIRVLTLLTFVRPRHMTVQLQSLHNAPMLRTLGIQNLLCLNELKMRMLAKSVTDCPGIITLMANLLNTSAEVRKETMDHHIHFSEHQREYLDGATCELFVHKLPAWANGKKAHRLYDVMARVDGLVLLAVKDEDLMHIWRGDFDVQEGMNGLFIGRDFEQVRTFCERSQPPPTLLRLAAERASRRSIHISSRIQITGPLNAPTSPQTRRGSCIPACDSLPLITTGAISASSSSVGLRLKRLSGGLSSGGRGIPPCGSRDSLPSSARSTTGFNAPGGGFIPRSNSTERIIPRTASSERVLPRSMSTERIRAALLRTESVESVGGTASALRATGAAAGGAPSGAGTGSRRASALLRTESVESLGGTANALRSVGGSRASTGNAPALRPAGAAPPAPKRVGIAPIAVTIAPPERDSTASDADVVELPPGQAAGAAEQPPAPAAADGKPTHPASVAFAAGSGRRSSLGLGAAVNAMARTTPISLPSPFRKRGSCGFRQQGKDSAVVSPVLTTPAEGSFRGSGGAVGAALEVARPNPSAEVPYSPFRSLGPRWKRPAPKPVGPGAPEKNVTPPATPTLGRARLANERHSHGVRIVLCGWPRNVEKFMEIATRSPELRIVIFAPTQPEHASRNSMRPFREKYIYVKGNPLDREELKPFILKPGLHSVIVFNEYLTDERQANAMDVVVCAANVESMLPPGHPNIQVLVTLNSSSDMRFVDRTSWWPSSEDPLYGHVSSPTFASGSAIANEMFYPLMMGWFKQGLIEFCTKLTDSVLDATEVNLIELPRQFSAGKREFRYGEIVPPMMAAGYLPIALYRRRVGKSARFMQPYVLTNPPHSTLVRKSDRVYVLMRNTKRRNYTSSVKRLERSARTIQRYYRQRAQDQWAITYWRKRMAGPGADDAVAAVAPPKPKRLDSGEVHVPTAANANRTVGEGAKLEWKRSSSMMAEDVTEANPSDDRMPPMRSEAAGAALSVVESSPSTPLTVPSPGAHMQDAATGSHVHGAGEWWFPQSPVKGMRRQQPRVWI